MKILVTGFEKFHTYDHNPTEIAVNKLEGSNLIKEILPVDIEKLPTLIPKLIKKHTPDIILFTGMAFSRPLISLEKIALNLVVDAKRKDNAGRDLSVAQEVIPAGLTLYNTLPLGKLNQHLKSKGLKSELSFDAGTYICNQTFYLGLKTIKELGLNSKCTFIHLPPNKDLNPQSEYTQENINSALQEIVTFCDTCL
jgi:pyroglutamyl-peptidase